MVVKIKMPLLGTGTDGDSYRPKYGGPGYHFVTHVRPDQACVICNEIEGIPIPQEIIDMEDVEILEGDVQKTVVEEEEAEEEGEEEAVAEEEEVVEETPAEEEAPKKGRKKKK